MKNSTFYKQVAKHRLGREIDVDERTLQLSEIKELPPVYQRDIQPKRLKRLIKEFEPMAMGVFVISARVRKGKGHEYWLLDGQHRMKALFAVSKSTFRWISRCPCMIFYGLTTDEESRLWVLLNRNRGQPTPSETLKAQIIAEDNVSLELLEKVHAYGFRFRFDSDNDKKGWPVIEAIKSLHMAQDSGVMDELFEVLAKLRHDGKVTGNFIKGITHFLRVRNNRDKVDIERLISILSVVPPDYIIKEAAQLHTHGTDLFRFIAHVIKERYNKGLRGRNKRIDYCFTRKPTPRRHALNPEDVDWDAE